MKNNEIILHRGSCNEVKFMIFFVSEEGGDGESVVTETSSLLSYTLRYVSLAELGNVCQVGFREPIHLSTFVSEEGGNGEGAVTEVTSLMSYTLRYEHEMCAIEELVFVTKLSFVPAHKEKTEGFRTTLSCALWRWYDSYGKGKEQAVQLSRERTTLLACLQDQ
jgi:hypothetical protein